MSVSLSVHIQQTTERLLIWKSTNYSTMPLSAKSFNSFHGCKLVLPTEQVSLSQRRSMCSQDVTKYIIYKILSLYLLWCLPEYDEHRKPYLVVGCNSKRGVPRASKNTSTTIYKVKLNLVYIFFDLSSIQAHAPMATCH